MQESTLHDVISACLSNGTTKFGATPTGAIMDVVKGLKAKGLNWLQILKYLPDIINAVQVLGPKVQEIIELISNLIEQLKPHPVPPVVNPTS